MCSTEKKRMSSSITRRSGEKTDGWGWRQNGHAPLDTS